MNSPVYGAWGVDTAILVAKITQQIKTLKLMHEQMKKSRKNLQEMNALRKHQSSRNKFVNQIISNSELKKHNSNDLSDKVLQKLLSAIDKKIKRSKNKIIINELQLHKRLLLAKYEAQKQIDMTSNLQLGDKEAQNQLVRNTALLIAMESNKKIIENSKKDKEREQIDNDINDFYSSLSRAANRKP